MAIPMIAGPGSIASIMLLMARSDGLDESLVVLGALGATLLLTLLCLLLAGPLMRLLGHRMEAMITRLLGVILAALAAQFVIDGIEAQLQRIDPPHPVGRVGRQRHRLEPVRAPCRRDQLHVEAVRRLRAVDGRFRQVRADQHIIDPVALRPSPGHCRRCRARRASRR